MRTWRTFAGVCWTGKRFDFDGGAQEILGRGRNPSVTALPCQPPLGKGAKGTGVRIATASVRTGFAMTRFLQGVRYKAGGRTEASAPTEGNKKPCGAGRRGRRPLRMGRGVRIATASVRTGFAMTLYSKCGVSPERRAGRGVHPYGEGGMLA